MIANDIIILEKNKNNCFWFNTYGIVPYLASKNHATKLLEIGVAYGYHAEIILSLNKEINYYGIDPYLANYDPNDVFSEDVRNLFCENDSQKAMDRLFNVVNNKFKTNYNNRAILFRGELREFTKSLTSKFDLIYIDGDHTYDAVIQDLKISWDIVDKSNGILCGDDYSWPQVKKAIDDFFNDKKLSYSLMFKQGFENLPVWYYSFNKEIQI